VDLSGSSSSTVSGGADAGQGASAYAPSSTATDLAVQMAQRINGQTTRFDLQLDPAGLGRVSVAVEITAQGAMSAALSFEKPEAASLLSAHAGALQQSLAQAGISLSSANLSFSTLAQDGRSSGGLAFSGGQPGQGGQGNGSPPQGGQAQTAGRAFGAASLAADHADQTYMGAQSLRARGLDIRI